MPCKAIYLLLVGALFTGSFPAAAQAAKTSASSTSEQSEAWTGVITYTRTQSQSDNKTVERVSGRGQDTRHWEMKFDYKATVGVSEAPEKNGSNIGKASITHSLTSTETSVAVERNSCDQGKTWQDMTGTFVSETKISGQGKTEANVYVGVNSDDTYTVSVGLPEIDGTVSGSQSSTFSGQCTPKPGKSNNLPETPIKIQGQSLTSDGSHRVDPSDPNRLSGSYSLSIPGGVVETITWSLQRHAVPLRITDLKFADMKYPTWNNWREITEQVGTVDGNWVKIKATVFNGSTATKSAELTLKETYKGDKWDGARPDDLLSGGSFSVTLGAGEAQEVELLWDSSGYAWYDDGRPRMVQRIKAELAENAKKVDEKTQNLKVAPKPLVMVAGIWTDPQAFEIYQNLLTTTHSYDWKAFTGGGNPAPGPIVVEGTVQAVASGRTVFGGADNLAKYVDETRRDRNAWHVDLLGHGTGGLAARLYVHKQMEVVPGDGRPVVKHLLLLGTPNNGVNCAEILAELFASEENKQIAKELAPEAMANFNKYVTQRKGTKFSALVGNPSPILCGLPSWSDGRVTIESAKFGIEDITLTSSLHGDLLSTANYSNYVVPHIVTGPKGTYPRVAAAAQK